MADMKKLTEEERVYRTLKGEIVTGKRNPGERIIVAQISQSLGTSAMPVRAALKMLQQDGLVEVVPYAGATVKKIDGKEYSEISAIRQLLEPYAAQLAVKCMSEQEIDELQKLLDVMEKCVKEGDNVTYSDYNTKFHTYINKHCGNQTLIDLIDQLANRSKITRNFYILRADRIAESLEEHKEILRLIRCREAEKVAEIIRKNKIGGYQTILRDILREL